MENYKICVENEAESKESQDLLFELGCFWNIKGREKDYLNIGSFTHLTTFDKYIGQGFGFVDHKEITLPELRDMVVLKRNLIDDATHVDKDGELWFASSDNKFHSWADDHWAQERENVVSNYNPKPIEKPMKEYLTKMQDGSYKLMLSKMGDDDIEVPEGAIKATLCDDFLIFWKGEFLSCNGGGDSSWKSNKLYPEIYYSFTEYTKKYDDAVIIWKRETLNDQVASAETARQSEKVLKEILEGDLPEFDFEAIDAFIESNVEQGQKHSHYKKDVSHLSVIDIYRVTEMFKPHSCGAHIAKKALCSGQRGHKDLLTDIQDIIDTAERWKEMLIEDENSCKD